MNDKKEFVNMMNSASTVESAGATECGFYEDVPVSPNTRKRISSTKEEQLENLHPSLKAFANSRYRASGATNVIFEEEEEIEAEREKSFIYSVEGLTSSQAENLLVEFGRNEITDKILPLWYLFVCQLWQPLPIMIWLAIIIEAGIQNFVDMGILLLIQLINVTIGFYEVTKTENPVTVLKLSLKPSATVKRDGIFVDLDPGLIVPGDLVLLTAGSAVPADCRVNEGMIEVDEAALSGDTLPVSMFKGDLCKMGSTVVKGEVEGTVEATGTNTFFGKTAVLIEQKIEYSNFQKILISITIILMIISLPLCFIVFLYLISIAPVIEAISVSIVLLIASIPLTIEIVTTTTLALGSKELSSQRVLVSRLTAIEDLATMSVLCTDKTGTLTLNKMVIQAETPIYEKGEFRHSLLRYAAMATKWREPPRDPLDRLILNSVDMDSLYHMEQLDFIPYDPVGKRTEGTVRNERTGEVFKTSKGSPHDILEFICKSSTPPEIKRLTKLDDSNVHALGLRGIRSLAVAKTDGDKNWRFLGLLNFLDPPRIDTRQAIEDAKFYGVAIKMITGDHVLSARETARVLHLGDYIRTSEGLPLLDPVTSQKPENLGVDYGDMCLAVDGFAQVLPEHKYLIIECLRELGFKTGMTGNGVNDAPGLKRADVGVAVEGATDATKAAADIVLTEPGLSAVVRGIIIARYIFVRIQNFLVYRIAESLHLLMFSFVAVFAFKPSEYQPDDWETREDFPDNEEWENCFHMPVLMLILTTLLNDGALLTIGFDNVLPRLSPEKWNLAVLFTVTGVLGAVSCLSSLLLLWVSLDSWRVGGIYQDLGLGGLSFGQIVSSIYLKVSVSDLLTLFSARTGKNWFWTTRPSWILVGAGSVALTVSTVLAVGWPESRPGGVFTLGLGLREPYGLPFYIWMYCIVWWVVQDACKVLTYYLLGKYNAFGFNETGKLQLPSSTLDYIKNNKVHDLAAL